MVPASEQQPEPPAEEPDGREEEQLYVWRYARFIEWDAPIEDALELARKGADWHRFADLRGRGCPPTVAARIVHP